MLIPTANAPEATSNFIRKKLVFHFVLCIFAMNLLFVVFEKSVFRKPLYYGICEGLTVNNFNSSAVTLDLLTTGSFSQVH